MFWCVVRISAAPSWDTSLTWYFTWWHNDCLLQDVIWTSLSIEALRGQRVPIFFFLVQSSLRYRPWTCAPVCMQLFQICERGSTRYKICLCSCRPLRSCLSVSLCTIYRTQCMQWRRLLLTGRDVPLGLCHWTRRIGACHWTCGLV